MPTQVMQGALCGPNCQPRVLTSLRVPSSTGFLFPNIFSQGAQRTWESENHTWSLPLAWGLSGWEWEVSSWALSSLTVPPESVSLRNTLFPCPLLSAYCLPSLVLPQHFPEKSACLACSSHLSSAPRLGLSLSTAAVFWKVADLESCWAVIFLFLSAGRIWSPLWPCAGLLWPLFLR